VVSNGKGKYLYATYPERTAVQFCVIESSNISSGKSALGYGGARG